VSGWTFALLEYSRLFTRSEDIDGNERRNRCETVTEQWQSNVNKARNQDAYKTKKGE